MIRERLNPLRAKRDCGQKYVRNGNARRSIHSIARAVICTDVHGVTQDTIDAHMAYT